ncbi:HupE/UreJ family protein [Sphingomonas sp.]|uniref:HupE/UreJ family protein n=1 Tax=Sphingomonas sp. TaxID=28214 RepID=UPI0025E44F6A|nr:HupE/UreJ family protein [Sphingomonas sp.]
MRIAIALRAILAIIALAFALPAAAHFTPNSEIQLDFGRTRAVAELIVPLSEISYALGRDLKSADQTEAYLRQHLRVVAPDGRPWQIAFRNTIITQESGGRDVHARVDLTPPAGAPLRVFDLNYTGVIDRVPNHFVVVLARNDFDAGRLSDRPRMIGGLQAGAQTLRVDRGPGSAWRGFVSAVGLGMHHIAEGHDHLLFLFALLLPAPLLVAAGRWAGFGGLRYTAHRLLLVVSAFTLGHSLTLIGGAYLGWQLPSRPVEVLIAVSILASALHAWRPLFAGREAIIAGGFGLIHGMAFATLIGRFGLDPWQKAQSILGFNLGIELVQVMVVAAVMPALILLARMPAYPKIRNIAAGFAGFAALAWIVERVAGKDNIVGRAIDAGLGQAPWLVAAATIAAATITLVGRSRSSASRRS